MGSKSQSAKAHRERIREIKRRIREGTYEIDYDQLAELLADELLPPVTDADKTETD